MYTSTVLLHMYATEFPQTFINLLFLDALINKNSEQKYLKTYSQYAYSFMQIVPYNHLRQGRY